MTMGPIEFYVEMKDVLGVVAASNPGHISACGLMSRERAKAIVKFETPPTDLEIDKLLAIARERMQDIQNTIIRLEAYQKARRTMTRCTEDEDTKNTLSFPILRRGIVKDGSDDGIPVCVIQEADLPKNPYVVIVTMDGKIGWVTAEQMQ